MKRAAKIYTALIFVFLFAPIVILLVFSFNEAKSLSVFSGFSLKWYRELFRDGETLNALKNTLILAVIASVVSTAMGTAAAVGMNKLRSKYLRAALDTATDIPMMNPDIITGISLMLMFVFFGRLLGASTSLGFWSMLAAHITFCLPYVIMQVLPKLQQMDRALPEAAMDLGCTPVRAFFRVEVPEILPGIMAGITPEYIFWAIITGLGITLLVVFGIKAIANFATVFVPLFVIVVIVAAAIILHCDPGVTGAFFDLQPDLSLFPVLKCIF